MEEINKAIRPRLCSISKQFMTQHEIMKNNISMMVRTYRLRVTTTATPTILTITVHYNLLHKPTPDTP